jgi:hypothetical protein
MLSWIARAFNWASGKVDDTIRGWVHDLISGLYSFLHMIFGGVIDAWNAFYKAVKAAETAIDDAWTELGDAFTYLWDHWWPDTYHWIITHILDPLLTAGKWIANEGATMWHYLTHAADLVEFFFAALIAKLESDAKDVAENLGGFVLHLLIKSTKDVLGWIEDVINAVL